MLKQFKSREDEIEFIQELKYHFDIFDVSEKVILYWFYDNDLEEYFVTYQKEDVPKIEDNESFSNICIYEFTISSLLEATFNSDYADEELYNEVYDTFYNEGDFMSGIIWALQDISLNETIMELKDGEEIHAVDVILRRDSTVKGGWIVENFGLGENEDGWFFHKTIDEDKEEHYYLRVID